MHAGKEGLRHVRPTRESVTRKGCHIININRHGVDLLLRFLTGAMTHQTRSARPTPQIHDLGTKT